MGSISVCGQALAAAEIQGRKDRWGCAGQENLAGELGFALGLKERPRFRGAAKDKK